jgi:hypothetical protein
MTGVPPTASAAAAAEFGGRMVVVQRAPGESRDAAQERAWFVARAIDPNSAPGVEPGELDGLSRAWACWQHTGCEYGLHIIGPLRSAAATWARTRG